MFVCVLRVLMKSLMTRGFRPVTTVVSSRMEWKSAVYIYLRSNLTAGAPSSTFFIGLNPDVREIFHDPYVFYDF